MGIARRSPLLTIALLLSACAVAPRGGPTAEAVRAAGQEAETVVPFAFAPLTRETVAALQARRAAPQADLGENAKVRPQILRPGDRVSVTIWEAVEGGLFSGEGAGAKSVALPPQRLGPSGRISVPYAGRIRAAGRTPAQVSGAIVAALRGKAIEPQALVTVEDSPVSAVTVIGDAAAGSGRVPLAGVGERVLDVIAAAGGTSAPAHRTLVRLNRGAAQGEAHLARILREPAQNVRVRAGDVVGLLLDEQTFTVLGAAGQPRRVPFSTEIVTLDEALAEAGGLDDMDANPDSVFVFRYEDAATARRLTGRPAEGPLAPVVYNLDLSDPGAFFLARRFEMRDGDILYAANAPLADARKVLDVVARALSPATTSLRLANGLD
ncbi:MAG: polysaccharide biosynthesis/export family protein [Pseudomonadota bacterium]